MTNLRRIDRPLARTKMTKKKTSSETKKIVVTARDWDILEMLALCGGLLSSHVSTLFFREDPKKWSPKPQTNAQKRLRDLFKLKYIRRIEQASPKSEGTEPNIHTLS